MSRPLPADFVPVRPEVLAPGRFIAEGDADPLQGETDLVANLHWCWAKLRTPIISTGFWADSGVSAGVQPYAIGAASATIRAIWVVPVVPGPWTSWEIRALVENTDAGNAATLRFQRSDGTLVNITVAAAAAAWTSVTGALAIDTALDSDTIAMLPIDPAAGVLRVHWVEIRPAALTSIPATKTTLEGGEVWCPIDALEVNDRSPLSVALRRRELANIEAIRQSRIETIVGWSDVANFRTPVFMVSAGSYVTVLRVPFRAGPRRTRVRWGVTAYIPSGTGYARLSTGAGQVAGTAVLVPLPVGWSSPYAANVVLWSDVGMGELDCAADAWGELIVELIGTTATLMGITAWLVDA